MQQRILGSSGLQVSAVGLGCVTFGREIGQDAAFEVMDRALETGITLFDTAEVYGAGRSEEVVGAWMRSRGTRRRIVLATKVAGTLTRERVLASAEASLRRLGADDVDLFQLHRWDPDVPLDETLDALDQVRTRGWTRAVGCSNYAAWQLAKALWRQDNHHWTPMVSVQQNYSLVVRDIEREHVPLCADQGLGILAYSPLGAGFLTGKYTPGQPAPAGSRFDVMPGHQEIYFSDRNFAIVKQLQGLAANWDRTLPHLALSWVMGRPGITSTLIGARSAAHVDQALRAWDTPLTSEQNEQLDQLTSFA